MAIITYTGGTLSWGDEVIDLGTGTVTITIRERSVIRDRSCVVCGAKWVDYSDGSSVFESCIATLHASERQVGVGFCLCGHPSAEHVWNPMVERASCMLCDALSEDCDRYRPSVRRNESDP